MAVRKLRRERSLTQEAFSGLVGVTAKTVSRWERGIDQPSLAKEAELRRLVAGSRGRIDDTILRALRLSAGVIVVIDENLRGLCASVGHAKFYGYDSNRFIGHEIERTIPPQAFDLFHSAGGPRRLLTQSNGFNLVLERGVDGLNRTGQKQCVQYVSAPVILDDGRHIWLSTGSRASPGSIPLLLVH